MEEVLLTPPRTQPSRDTTTANAPTCSRSPEPVPRPSERTDRSLWKTCLETFEICGATWCLHLGSRRSVVPSPQDDSKSKSLLGESLWIASSAEDVRQFAVRGGFNDGTFTMTEEEMMDAYLTLDDSRSEWTAPTFSSKQEEEENSVADSDTIYYSRPRWLSQNLRFASSPCVASSTEGFVSVHS